MRVERLSENRAMATSKLMLQGDDGDFVVVHQDTCACKTEVGRCTCVPDVWRVQRGKA